MAQEFVFVPFPDFITSANLELMLLASFLLFFWGAILTDWRLGDGDWTLGDGVLRLNIKKFEEFGVLAACRWVLCGAGRSANER